MVLFLSCHGKNNLKDVQVVFANEVFDQEIIRNFKLYDTLEDIFISNVDTIFNYRAANNDSGKEKLPVDISYRFDYPVSNEDNSNQISLKTLPPFLFVSVDKIFKTLGPNKITAIDLTKNPLSMVIILKNKSDDKTYVETQHTLDWNWDYRNQHIPFTKDTVIAAHWIYYINCEKDPDLWW